MAKTSISACETETTVVLFLLIYAGFAGQTHKCRRDNVFLYLESLLCSQTDFNFQIFNLPQLLLYFSHFPHVKLPIYLHLNPKFNPTKFETSWLTLSFQKCVAFEWKQLRCISRVSSGCEETCRRMLTNRETCIAVFTATPSGRSGYCTDGSGTINPAGLCVTLHACCRHRRKDNWHLKVNLDFT